VSSTFSCRAGRKFYAFLRKNPWFYRAFYLSTLFPGMWVGGLANRPRPPPPPRSEACSSSLSFRLASCLPRSAIIRHMSPAANCSVPIVGHDVRSASGASLRQPSAASSFPSFFGFGRLNFVSNFGFRASNLNFLNPRVLPVAPM
jgi:hypothetical protein